MPEVPLQSPSSTRSSASDKRRQSAITSRSAVSNITVVQTRSMPELPPGSTSFNIQDTLSFHRDPHRYISSKIASIEQDAKRQETPCVISARLLNRKVAIFLSYETVKFGLEMPATSDSSIRGSLSCETAYRQLMGEFFPDPNVLLHDHSSPDWNRLRNHMTYAIDLGLDHRKSIRTIIFDHMNIWNKRNSIPDTYRSMKDLATELIFKIFLSLSTDDDQYHVLTSKQTISLRGQFAVPVSFSKFGFENARSKGLRANAGAYQIIKERLEAGKCPLNDKSPFILAGHLPMFCSSLVVKALASFLTALIFQLGRKSREAILPMLHHRYRENEDVVRSLLRGIVLETERLSPPIIGTLRNVTSDITIGQSTVIPAGWDCWFYYPSANRDSTIYAPHPCLFQYDRFLKSTPDAKIPPDPLSFGSGPKHCLGFNIIHSIAEELGLIILETGADLSFDIDEKELPYSVQSWLGWQVESYGQEDDNAMKRLPTQRPRHPVNMRFSFCK